MTEYNDTFTLDGRVKVVPGVTEAKVEAVMDLSSRAMKGDRLAKGTLEEAMVSTDAVFNLAHVAAITALADFDELPRKWDQIANVRTVQDFRPVTLYTLRPDWAEGGVLGDGTPRWVAPRIPEAANYPYAHLTEETNQSVGGVVKRGFKTGFTFEAFINDSVGFLQSLPNSMRDIALDTDEWEVFTALVTGVGDDQQVNGGTIPDGTSTVSANPAISRNALIRAIIELNERQIDSRTVVVSGGYQLIVPIGQGIYVQYAIQNEALVARDSTSGSNVFKFQISGYDPLAGIEIIESEWVTGTNWYLIPKQNAARRPVLELLRLAGHEVPELRVQGNTGDYVGGGSVSPFEGNFDNDTADFRLRMFSKGILWTPDLIIWSDGSGVA